MRDVSSPLKVSFDLKGLTHLKGDEYLGGKLCAECIRLFDSGSSSFPSSDLELDCIICNVRLCIWNSYIGVSDLITRPMSLWDSDASTVGMVEAGDFKPELFAPKSKYPHWKVKHDRFRAV